MREGELIERIKKMAGASRDVRVGIGDDAAVLRVRRGEETVLTTDMCLEGRHFLRAWGGVAAGHRCLARGLSDVAAMGARPVAAFLSLAVPAGLNRRWMDGFLRGLTELAAANGVAIAGGDTGRSPGEFVLADIVLVGAVPRGKALLRTGARVGDGLYVTGVLGAAAAALREGRGAAWRAEPRLAVGRRLVGLASAAMDLSDGLSTDLARLCAASGVGAVVDEAALPLGGSRSREPQALADALDGGEDYELLFAARGAVPKTIAGVAVTRVGEIVRRGKDPVTLRGADGRERVLKAAGWEHAF